MSTVQGTPVFSKYISLRNDYEIGIHKFIVTSDGPLIGNTVQWDVKRLGPGSTVGGSLGLAGQKLPLSVTVAAGTNRQTAECVFTAARINGWTDVAPGTPHEVYICTFHFGAENSSHRTS